ncbi:MAG: hypothetical protein ABIO95_07595 [Bdellovibrionota bacterium]
MKAINSVFNIFVLGFALSALASGGGSDGGSSSSGSSSAPSASGSSSETLAPTLLSRKERADKKKCEDAGKTFDLKDRKCADTAEPAPAPDSE